MPFAPQAAAVQFAPISSGKTGPRLSPNHSPTNLTQVHHQLRLADGITNLAGHRLMTCSLALATSGPNFPATAVGSPMKPRLAWLGISQAQTPKSKTSQYHSMSGIPIKTGGWRDKARWGQPCFFSSPRPTVSPKEEAIDTPNQAPRKTAPTPSILTRTPSPPATHLSGHQIHSQKPQRH